MNKYFAEDQVYITNALESIDVDVLSSVIDLAEKTLRSGKKIIATGLGKNVPICEKFEGTMLSLGFDARFMHTNTAVHGDLGMIKPGDLVFVLTKSGSTAESIYLVDLLKKRQGVQLVLLSFKERSPLANKIENKIIIKLEHEGDLWDIVPNHSTTLNLIVLQKIAIELSKRFNLSLDEDFKPNHPGGAIGEKLNG